MYKLIQKLVLTLFVSISTIAVADDIDIFDTVMPINSNALVVMDMSGSMQWGLNDEETPADPADSRKNVLHTALKAVLDKLDDPNLPNINIGISSFSGNVDDDEWSQRAHGITYPVKPLSADANVVLNSNTLFTHNSTNSYLPSVATGNTTKDFVGDIFPGTWVPRGATPIVDSLYEAALYYRGNSPYSGWRIPTNGNSAHPSTYTGLLKEVPITSCPIGDPRRYECSGSSCNQAFKECHTEEDHAFTCWGSSCVNNEETNNGATCSSSISTGTTNCPEGVTMCGDANSSSDCTSDNKVWDSYCSLGSASDCEDTGLQNCVSSEAGGYKCKKNVTIYTCPIHKYPCTKDITVCTSCPSSEVKGPAKYISPINNKCSINSIVLLTDGEPSLNKRAWDVSGYIGSSYNNNCAVKTGNDFRDYGRCGKELAKFLANEDNDPSTLNDKEIVRTHTIGFALQKQRTKDYLQEIATAGKGKYITADTPDALANALYKTITYYSRARSFSSPSYKINTSTFLTHDKYAYVPLFDRDINETWSGNLKKYEVRNGELYGKDDTGTSVQATDASGRLKEGVRDLWATGPSTDLVTSGGAAGLLSHSSRTIYTDKSGSLVNINTATQAQLNAADSTEKNILINFIRGENPDGSDRKHMGDIIHSKPLPLLTSKTEGVLFVGTDEGYLHAIKTSNGSDDGKELFAYMPQELLKNIKSQYRNDGTNSHSYGVDGEMTLWHDDTNHNGIKESGETAMLFFGLRRGGKAYYALNVTNPASPVLAWKITNSGSFSNLGFTWSKPKLAMLKYKKGASLTAKPEPVLIFGGGYVDDNHNEADDSGTGANVYIVNAKTGSLLLRVGGAISHAIPGNIRIIDFDRNGSVDRLYFADTGANIWRVDLNADSTAPYDLSKAKLTKFAALGGTSAGDKRKFFNEPDVAIFQHNSTYAVSVSIGTGMRPKPLDSVVLDYFYMLLDENVFNVPPSTFQTITPSKLKNAPLSLTDNLLAQLHDTNAKKGWKLELNSALNGLDGEKVLSTSLTFQNKVLFTTFGVKSISTVTVDSNNCGISNNNSSRFYALDLLTGKAALNLDSSDTSINDSTDSSIQVTTDEILDTPKIIYGSGFESKNGGPCTKDDCIRPFEIHVGNVPAVATNETKPLKSISIEKTLPRVYWIDQKK